MNVQQHQKYGRHQQRGIDRPAGCPRAQFAVIDGGDGNPIQTNRKLRRAARKKTLGQPHRRILVTRESAETVWIDGRRQTRKYEYSYHATKGWRRTWVL